jgi:hypothetical protein
LDRGPEHVTGGGPIDRHASGGTIPASGGDHGVVLQCPEGGEFVVDPLALGQPLLTYLAPTPVQSQRMGIGI